MESSLEGEIEKVIKNMAEKLLKNEQSTKIVDKPVPIKQVNFFKKGINSVLGS